MKLSIRDWWRLRNSAKQAQRIENKWNRRIEDLIEEAAEHISEPDSALVVPDFEWLLIEHWFDVTITALKVAESEKELKKTAPRLAAKKSIFQSIMEKYDAWRKGKWKPKRPVRYAEKMRRTYIAAVQKAWRTIGKDFRSGGEQTKEEIRDRIRKSAKTVVSRAQTIVRTETTREYNRTRRQFYDRAEDITHYLFMAVRDTATTPWCTSKTTNGKRGRHGLVYAKTDPLLKAETPPCHWNCRSELLPLNRFNPTHQRLIADRSISRRSHQCYPLPPEWSK